MGIAVITMMIILIAFSVGYMTGVHVADEQWERSKTSGMEFNGTNNWIEAKNGNWYCFPLVRDSDGSIRVQIP